MLALVLAAAIAAAPARFTCGDRPTQSSIEEVSSRLLPMTAKEFAARYASFDRTQFGPFANRYGIEQLDAYTRVVESKSKDDDDTDTSYDVPVIFVVKRRGVTHYYRFANKADENLSAEYDKPQLAIGLGTPDRELPILRLSFVSIYRGAHSGSHDESVSYIDFGFSSPRVIAKMVCSDGWMGGACGAFDSRSWTQVKCSWSAAKRDYDCQVHKELDADWVNRSEVRSVDLFAHRERMPQGVLPSLAALAVAARADHKLSSPVVAGVGTLQSAGVLANRWLLFVSTSLDVRQMLRIFVVDLTTDAPAQPIVVKTLTAPREDEPPPDPDIMILENGFTPLTVPFSIARANVAKESSLEIVSLVLQEKKQRAVFWIGGDAATGALDAMRLASDAPEYKQCDRFTLPDSASSIRIARPFFATMHVEPSWLLYNDGAESDGEKSCERIAHVKWGKGFEIEWEQAECRDGLPAHRVVIGKNGELSTGPLPPPATE